MARRRPRLASDRHRVSDVAQATRVTCTPSQLLGEAAARLVDSGCSHAWVTSGDGADRPIGWLNARDVVRAAARDPAALAELSVRAAMVACAGAPEDASSLDLLWRMREAKTNRIALVSPSGSLMGVVSLGDLACLASAGGAEGDASLARRLCECLAERSRGRGGSPTDEVRDVMSAGPMACRLDDALPVALERVHEGDVPCLPVLGGDRRLAGILGSRDLCRALVREARATGSTALRSVVNEKVASCWPDDSLEAALAIMRAYRVRRLPVVESRGQLEGVLSLSDVARAVLAEERPDFARGRAAEVVETLAAITRGEAL